MLEGSSRTEQVLSQLSVADHHSLIFAVNNWRGKPLEQNRISLKQQFQALSEIPAIDVQIAFNGQFDHPLPINQR
jgi:hypothetical protein